MPLPTSAPKPAATQTSIRSFFKPHLTDPSAAPSPLSQAPPQQILAPAPAPAPEPELEPTATPPPPAEPAQPTHPNATIRLITPADLPALKRVNSLLLPVPYGDSFYKAAVTPSASGPFSRVITWTEDPPLRPSNPLSSAAQRPREPRVIGSIVCKVVSSTWVTSGVENTFSRPPDDNVLYIQSLCVLAPYRRLGLAAAALEDVIQKATAEYPELRIAAVCAHVWTENDEGLKWYRACGFKISDKPLEGYYHQLRPGSAWVARRRLPPSQLLNGGPMSNGIVDAVTNAVAANRPPAAARGQSYQKVGPANEWNDLPEDMMTARFGPRETPATNSGASSRSSSTVGAGRKKKERAYPAAAFGQ